VTSSNLFVVANDHSVSLPLKILVICNVALQSLINIVYLLIKWLLLPK